MSDPKSDTTTKPKVSLGGTFLFSEDPAALAEWYASRMGFAFNKAGETAFYLFWESQELEDPARTLQTHFSVMKLKLRSVTTCCWRNWA